MRQVTTERRTQDEVRAIKKRLYEEQHQLGVTKFELMSHEALYLPQLLHNDEHIYGAVYGYHTNGIAALIATNRRILFIDRKPLFSDVGEIDFRVVSGISLSHAGIGATITLHTRVQDYCLRTLNQKCMYGFADYIESVCLEPSKNR